MLGSWARVFFASLISSLLALQIAPWELTGQQALAVLWSAVMAVLVVVLNWLNPNDPRYGRGAAEVDPLGGDA